jgi:hypothetical protein
MTTRPAHPRPRTCAGRDPRRPGVRARADFHQADLDAFAQVSGDFSLLHAWIHIRRAPSSAAASSTAAARIAVLATRRHARSGNAGTLPRAGPGVPAAVVVGETVRAIAKVTGRSEATRTLSLATEIRALDGKVIVSGTAKVKVRTGGHRRFPATHRPGRHFPGTRRASRRTGASRHRRRDRPQARARRHDGRGQLLAQPRPGGAVVQAVRAAEHRVRCARDVRDRAAVDACRAHVGAGRPPTVLVNAAIGSLAPRAPSPPGPTSRSTSTTR